MLKLFYTLKINRILSLLFISLSFSQYVEIDLGYNRSNGALDKYTDDGISIRASYSNNINESKFFRWQGSFQFISFYTDTWTDEFAMASGLDGPDIEVKNSERGYTLQGGVRFTPERGLFQQNSVFKPYATFNVGAVYLQEKTVYSDPDWGDNTATEFSLDDIEDYRFKFIYSIEFGSNFNFKKWDGYGFDFGVRYNMIPGIEKTETENIIYIDETQKFKNKIDADYYTIYIGVTLDLEKINTKKEKIDKGRHF